MPEASVAIIRGQKLGPGASLVKLENDLQRPTAKDWSCGVLRARAAQGGVQQLCLVEGRGGPEQS